MAPGGQVVNRSATARGVHHLKMKAEGVEKARRLNTDVCAYQARFAGLPSRAVGFDPTAGKAYILPVA